MTAESFPLRLRRLETIFVRSPIYFVTACTADRRRILATPEIHASLAKFGKNGVEHGAWIGAYVLMPDHFHLFVAVDDERIKMAEWTKSLKNALSKALRSEQVPPHTSKRVSLTIFYAAPNRTPQNGIMFAIIQCVLVW
jgi:REP element-mobilizing transposase RayT